MEKCRVEKEKKEREEFGSRDGVGDDVKDESEVEEEIEADGGAA